jgi:hypothetical protein
VRRETLKKNRIENRFVLLSNELISLGYLAVCRKDSKRARSTLAGFNYFILLPLKPSCPSAYLTMGYNFTSTTVQYSVLWPHLRNSRLQ